VPRQAERYLQTLGRTPAELKKLRSELVDVLSMPGVRGTLPEVLIGSYDVQSVLDKTEPVETLIAANRAIATAMSASPGGNYQQVADSFAAYYQNWWKNLEGTAEQRSTYFADVMAYSASAVKTTTGQLSEALGKAAPTAALAGQSFRSTAAALAVLQAQKFEGAAAAEGLSTYLKNVGRADTALQKFGLTLFDTKGNQLPIEQQMRVLATAFPELASGMELSKEKGEELARIFGDDLAVKAAKAMAMMGDALSNMAYEGKIAGKSLEMSSIAVGDSWSNAMEDLQNVITKVKMSIAEGLGPDFQRTVDRISKAVNNLDKLTEKHPVLGDVGIKAAEWSAISLATNPFLATTHLVLLKLFDDKPKPDWYPPMLPPSTPPEPPAWVPPSLTWGDINVSVQLTPSLGVDDPAKFGTTIGEQVVEAMTSELERREIQQGAFRAKANPRHAW